MVTHFQFGVRGRENYQMFDHFDSMGHWIVLGLNRPVRRQEDDEIKGYEREGDNGPPTPLQVFVAEG